jgi:hypothetical protein
MTDHSDLTSTSRPPQATHPRRRRARLAAAVTGAAALVGAAVVTTSPTASATAYSQDLKTVRVATARFHSPAQALRAGYLPSPECVAAGPLGAMGFHYENPALMADPAIDAAQPEVLLYAPGADGDLELVGVEYFRNAGDGAMAPSLYGQTFDGPMPGHHPGMGVHYGLHAWVWTPNPSGTFAQFNPDVSC